MTYQYIAMKTLGLHFNCNVMPPSRFLLLHSLLPKSDLPSARRIKTRAPEIFFPTAPPGPIGNLIQFCVRETR